MAEKQSTGNRKGGARPGAGRPKGSPNKATQARQAAIAASGVTPLEFMLNIMRGEAPEGADVAQRIAWESMRFEAAKAAAPYVHPKLANVEHTGKGGGPITILATPEDQAL